MDILFLILYLLMIVLVILCCAELLVPIGYLIFFIWRAVQKGGNIEKAHKQTDRVLDTKSKGLTQVCEPLEALLHLYEDPQKDINELTLGASLHSRMTASREVLFKNGIIRKLRFVNVESDQAKSGKLYRKWDQGGKEWRACTLSADALDEYIDIQSGRVLTSIYYPSVKVYFFMSRRLAVADKTAAAQKDKWGRKIVKTDTFYEGKHLENCPSCGAPLPKGMKDVVCPYCNSTIFSDYYDWQLESYEVEPERIRIRGLIGWVIIALKSADNAARVKKKAKEKIVRFSENDFRQDVYESFRNSENSDELIDLWLGDIDIKKITNTETDTILNVSVPIHKTVICRDETGQISVRKQESKERTDFTRIRYPDRFNKKMAVVSGERFCKNCGAAYTADENGNCLHCGAFLFIDNVKWRKA